jgi:Cof subfamily protein (haloacid dehalogenase superfamily)
MIKAVFFDIDGTLVSFETHQIPDSTLTALQELKEKGIYLFVATGRGKDGLKVLDGIDFDGYITLNGQYCFTKEKEVIYSNTIPPEDIDVLLGELKKKIFPCGFTIEQGKVYNYRDERVEELHRITKNDGQPAGDVSHVRDVPVYQIQAFVNPEEETELMAKMKHCTSARWYPTFCDISPIGGTKVLGMDLFAKRFGFSRAEMMAFGDGGNDMAMLKHASISVAMGNGTEELKKCASYVTEDADHHGVADALRHYADQFAQ